MKNVLVLALFAQYLFAAFPGDFPADPSSLSLTGSISAGAITASGVVSAPLGTVGAVSYGFTTDGNTGMYSPGADQVALVTGGVSGLTINTAGDVTAPRKDIYASRTAAGSAVQIRAENSDNTNANSHSQFVATVAGSTAGDPKIIFGVTGGATFGLGIDNNDSDQFKIGNNATLGTPAIAIDTTNKISRLDFATAAANTTAAALANTPGAVAGTQAGWVQVQINGTVSYLPFWQ